MNFSGPRNDHGCARARKSEEKRISIQDTWSDITSDIPASAGGWVQTWYVLFASANGLHYQDYSEIVEKRVKPRLVSMELDRLSPLVLPAQPDVREVHAN